MQPTLQGLEDRDLKSTALIPSGVILDQDVVDLGSATDFPPSPCSPAPVPPGPYSLAAFGVIIRD